MRHNTVTTGLRIPSSFPLSFILSLTSFSPWILEFHILRGPWWPDTGSAWPYVHTGSLVIGLHTNFLWIRLAHLQCTRSSWLAHSTCLFIHCSGFSFIHPPIHLFGPCTRYQWNDLQQEKNIPSVLDLSTSSCPVNRRGAHIPSHTHREMQTQALWAWVWPGPPGLPS